MLINRKQNKEKSSEQIKLNFGVAEGLAAENANLWYGDFQALKGITMDIPAQKVTAFIGPSGCGKSTFLKCFNRMNDLVSGVKITGDLLTLSPCLPSGERGVTIRIKRGDCDITVDVDNTESEGDWRLSVDGVTYNSDSLRLLPSLSGKRIVLSRRK